jgi:REP element-mobilizing transposase RayT
MVRPLRIEFPGAVYHVTARGNRRESIFVSDRDRATLLRIAGDAMLRFDGRLLAFCLMGNHYHLVLRTERANLSQTMRHVNGVYTQTFNQRHTKVGHVFQGRFKAILVDSDAYLRTVCRYVDLNPVRAGLVDDPAAWRWSSYRMHMGLARSPDWLDSGTLMRQLLGRSTQLTAQDICVARSLYADFVSAADRDAPLWERALRQQIYLGDEAFVERMQAIAMALGEHAPAAPTDRQPALQRPGDGAPIPRAQTRPPLALQHWLSSSSSRDHALRRAHFEGGLSLSAIAREIGLSASRVSRLVARAAAVGQEDDGGGGQEAGPDPT